MKEVNLPSTEDTRQSRGPLSFREYLLIAATVAALFFPSVIRLPHHRVFTTDRTNFPTSLSPSTCTITDEIATIIIACGSGETDAVAEMRPLLTSIILLSSIPLRFIFITDDDGVIRIQKMFTDLGRTQRPIVVQTVRLSREWMTEWTAQTKIDMFTHHSGMFGMSKLATPWLLPNIKLGVVLDTDMVLLKDFDMLWHEALREEGEGFQKGWVYRMIQTRGMEKPSQMCSCVMAIRLQQAREENICPEVIQNALTTKPTWFRRGLYRPPHGDQGIFYALWQHNQRIVGKLDSVWNMDHCHKFYGVFNEGDTQNVGILHRNCYNTDDPKRNQTNDGSPPFFEFYERFKWHWLRAPEGQGCDIIVEGA